MRKVVANLFISLDGAVERPDQWHFPYFDDEMGQVVGAGKRLFEGETGKVPLELLSSRTFGTGVVYLVYGRSAEPGA
jgi:hypothetical protein